MPPKRNLTKAPPESWFVFFEKSRDQWKSKHHQAKANVKRLSNRICFLEKSKGQLKNRVQEQEKEIERLKARERALEQALENLGKKESRQR